MQTPDNQQYNSGGVIYTLDGKSFILQMSLPAFNAERGLQKQIRQRAFFHTFHQLHLIMESMAS